MLGKLELPRTCEMQMQDVYSADEYTHYHPQSSVIWPWDHLPTKIGYRWKDANPGTAAVMWQISLLPFTDGRVGWEYPPGIVAHGVSPKSNYEWTNFTIDFPSFAPKPGTPVVPAIRIRKQGSGTSSQPLLTTDEQLMIRRALELRSRKLNGPVSLWVRVVPITANRKPNGHAARQTEVIWGPQPPANVTLSPGMTPPAANHPKVRVAEYIPLQWSGNPYLMLCVQDWPPQNSGTSAFWPQSGTVATWSPGSVFKAGQTYDFTPRPNGWFENFVDSIGGLISFIADVVNWVSKAYDDLKKMVIDAVCSVLGDKVRGLVTAGLAIGMAAIGMPPSLPNFDDLASMGADYLENVVIEQVPGLPPDEAKSAINAFVSAAKSTAEHGDGSAILIPAPSQRRRPAVVWLEASNTTGQPTTSLDAQILFSTYTPDWHRVADLTGQSYPDGFKPQQVYKSRDPVHIPSIKPGQPPLRIPVVLEPTYDEEKDPNNVQWMCWKLGYEQPQTMWVNTYLRNPVQGGPYSVGQQQQITFTPAQHYP
jgi:hypothetical protein